ncbi:MAG: 3-phosphoshikimate 1-carboxyvinyltransferase [Acidimicrobiales bacterium]
MSSGVPLGLGSPVLGLEASGPVSGILRAPPSKSVTNRLLVIASLAHGTSIIKEPLVSDDTEVMARGLARYGAVIDLSEHEAVVTGTGGVMTTPDGVVMAGLSGTTLRFLAAVSLLANGSVILDGEPALRRRPLQGLLEALAETGARVTSTDGHAPVVIQSAGLPGGRVRVDARESSQFATALLLVAPYAATDSKIVVEHLGAAGYVEMTASLMSRWGAVVEGEPDTLMVRAARHYTAGEETVEYDASAAAHLFALGLATGGAVTVANTSSTAQPDSAITELFGEMGAVVHAPGTGGLTVSASGEALQGVSADMSRMPDQLATMAVLGALANGLTRLRGLSVTRGHETDRLVAVARELDKLGADVRADHDELVVKGGRRLHGGVVETYADHRMAMAFSALGCAVRGVRIASPGCVAKTYPGWWSDLDALGVRVVTARASPSSTD